MHDAGAALRGVAADMRAGEPQVLAQQLHQKRARVDIGGDGLTVHRQGNGCHGAPPRKIAAKRLEFTRRSGKPAVPKVEIGAILPTFGPWNENNSEPEPYRWSREFRRQCRRTTRRAPRSSSGLAADARGEFQEEIVGDLLGGAVDQALAELGELAADLRLDIVGEQRAAVLVGVSLTTAPPLAKPATPPSPWPEIL